MTRVVLHVGYPKTATTWLQKVVLPRHPELVLLRRATPGCEWIQQLLADHPFDFTPDRHRAAIDASFAPLGERVAFISHEAYLGDPFLGGINSELAAPRLAALFPDARIVIVIREQGAMIDSLYRQYVQEGGVATPEQLFADPSALRVRFARGYLAYDRACALFAAHFGRARVRVLLFERLLEAPDQFLGELYDHCGVAHVPLVRSDDVGRNVGLASPALEILRTANRVLTSSFQPQALLPMRSRTLRRALQRRSARSSAARPAVPEPLSALLRASYREGNRRLRDELGLPVEQAGYAV